MTIFRTDSWTVSESLLEWLGEWVADEDDKRSDPWGEGAPDYEGPIILELGSGLGTSKLVDLFGHEMVFSIEQNEEWLNKYHDNYIYAPLKEHKPIKNHDGNLWYDARVLERELPKIDYDIILVDGPCPPGGRAGLTKYFDLFKHDVPIVFDDLHRYRDFKIIKSISGRLEKPFTVYGWSEKNWGVIND